MTQRIRTAGPASREFADAVRWYEQQRAGLGGEFFNAVGNSLELIAAHPEIGTDAFDAPETRRVLVARFPYQIVYRLGGGEIVIVAFAHLKRRPGFWKHRV